MFTILHIYKVETPVISLFKTPTRMMTSEAQGLTENCVTNYQKQLQHVNTFENKTIYLENHLEINCTVSKQKTHLEINCRAVYNH